MAVTVFTRSHRHARHAAAALPPVALLATLIAPALDLVHALQPGVGLSGAALLASGAASLVLLAFWARYPRTGWLAAAALAALASVAVRLAGAEVGAALSVLAIFALGLGGAFASPAHELDAMLDLSPESPDGSSGAAPLPTPERLEPPKAA